MDIDLGRYRVYLIRLTSYLGIVSILMILKVFAEDEPLGWKWYIWLILILFLSVFLIYFDNKYVIKKEGDYGISKTPRWVAMEKKIGNIENKTDDIYTMVLEIKNEKKR